MPSSPQSRKGNDRGSDKPTPAVSSAGDGSGTEKVSVDDGNGETPGAGPTYVRLLSAGNDPEAVAEVLIKHTTYSRSEALSTVRAAAPTTFHSTTNPEQAEAIRRAIEEAGGRAELVHVPRSGSGEPVDARVGWGLGCAWMALGGLLGGIIGFVSVAASAPPCDDPWACGMGIGFGALGAGIAGVVIGALLAGIVVAIVYARHESSSAHSTPRQA
jgi:hypothetical protein